MSFDPRNTHKLLGTAYIPEFDNQVLDISSLPTLPISESNVTGLVADLANKSNVGHVHPESQVTNLVADLAGKAASVHTHPESDVTNLVADLAGKAASVHTHVESDVTNLVADLAGKAAGANTDTAIVTPAPGQKVKLLEFHVTNKGAAAAAGHVFELRFGGRIITSTGWDSAAAPIGQVSKPVILNDEIVGNGQDAIQGRNLVVLAASEIATYSVSMEIT